MSIDGIRHQMWLVLGLERTWTCNLALEAEGLEFVRNFENPKAYPIKKQLKGVGRLDHVDDDEEIQK